MKNNPMEEVVAKTKELALLIDKNLPDGREKCVALEKLQESIMWFRAGTEILEEIYHATNN